MVIKMSVELSEEKVQTNGLKLEKARYQGSVKSEASEEAHALSSTRQRKGEQGARTYHDDTICTYQRRGPEPS